MKRLVVLLGVLVASPAWAANQWQDCSSAHAAGAAIPADQMFLSTQGGKKTLCYDVDDTTDSTILSANSCDHIDILVFNLTDGTSDDIELKYRNCGTSTSSTSTCWVAENVTLTGGAAADLEAIYGLASEYGFIDMVTNTNGDDVRVLVRCND